MTSSLDSSSLDEHAGNSGTTVKLIILQQQIAWNLLSENFKYREERLQIFCVGL